MNTNVNKTFISDEESLYQALIACWNKAHTFAQQAILCLEDIQLKLEILDSNCAREKLPIKIQARLEIISSFNTKSSMAELLKLEQEESVRPRRLH